MSNVPVNTKNVWIFDVDGVLVNIEQWKVVEMQLIEQIAKRLMKGDLVALVSGRSVYFQRDDVISLLKEYLQHAALPFSLLNNVYLSGEFGGTSMTYSNGQDTFHANQELILPAPLLSELQKATEPFLADFVPEDKITIFTVFCRKREKFLATKDLLMLSYQTTVERYHLQDEIEIHQDPSSINVKYKKATKHYATEQVLRWIDEKKAKPTHFYAFGDALSDIQIGETLQSKGFLFTFVFVGNPKLLENQLLSFTPVFPQQKEDKGTLEFLTQVA